MIRKFLDAGIRLSAVAILWLGLSACSNDADAPAAEAGASAVETRQSRANPTVGSGVRVGQSAFESGSFAEAMRILKPLADGGNATAQFYVAKMYRHGNGVDQSLQAAVDYYSRSANQEYAKSQNNLARLYEAGEGVKQNFVKARALYERAAEGGSATAMGNLSELYVHGRGVNRDREVADYWAYRSVATKQNSAEAQHQVALRHKLGVGTSQNAAEAERWFRQAAAQGYEPSRRELQQLGAAPAVAASTQQPSAPVSISELKRRYPEWAPVLESNPEMAELAASNPDGFRELAGLIDSARNQAMDQVRQESQQNQARHAQCSGHCAQRGGYAQFRQYGTDALAACMDACLRQ